MYSLLNYLHFFWQIPTLCPFNYHIFVPFTTRSFLIRSISRAQFFSVSSFAHVTMFLIISNQTRCTLHSFTHPTYVFAKFQPGEMFAFVHTNQLLPQSDLIFFLFISLHLDCSLSLCARARVCLFVCSFLPSSNFVLNKL